MSKKKQQTEEARQRLRDAGLRATPARIAIFNLMTENQRPWTHQEITEKLEATGIDKSTIFRSLSDLTTAGLARRMELGDHVWRYELAQVQSDKKATSHTHPHLLCVDCGSVTCLSDEDVELTVSKSVGQIEDVLLKGHCNDCGPSK